jgi:hypothetical protein
MNSTYQMRRWYERAQIDYAQHYMGLYASFNAWYRLVTGFQNDREALNCLRKGNILWDEYCEGTSMQSLVQYMSMLVECTQREPICYTTPHWKGQVRNMKDWPSLVEFWYRVRCLVMHGAMIQPEYIYLAYETLNVFMNEAIHREY